MVFTPGQWLRDRMMRKDAYRCKIARLVNLLGVLNV